MENLVANEFMESDPIVARPEMTVAELVELLWSNRVRALPVVDEQGLLVGVVSETDLFLKEKGVPFSLEKVTTLLGQPVAGARLEGLEHTDRVTVGEVMTPRPISVGPETTLEQAARVMHERRFSVLPVTEGGRLVGMMRRINLLRRIYATPTVDA